MHYRRTVLTVGSCLLVGGCLDSAISRESGFGEGSNTDLSDRQRSIVSTYDTALEERNEATTTRDSGITLFNDEEFARAVDAFKTAREDYQIASSGFATAAEDAREIGETEAAELCSTAEQETSIQLAATDAALEAARAGRTGEDTANINAHIKEYQEFESEAAELSVKDTDTLVEVLGLS